MEVIGLKSNKIYFEGTRADCHKWLLETYPTRPERPLIDGELVHDPLLPEEMMIRGKVK